MQFCLDEAERLGLEVPGTRQVTERYERLQALGEGRSDASVLVKQLDSKAATEC